MRALKRTLALAGLLILVRYFSIYYYTSEFNHFVQKEAQRTRQKAELKREILDKAETYSLPINEDNITITTGGAIISVAVDYRVPIDFLIYRHELAFRTIGSGLLRP
jgi:hypothetical protein